MIGWLGASARIAASVATAVVLAGSAAPVAAGGPSVPGTSLPDEAPAVDLARSASASIAFDLDGDGVREVVAVTSATGSPGFTAVQAWFVTADGAEETNQVRLRRSASVDELLGGRGRLGIDRDDMIRVRITEPARFLVVQRDGSDVLLLATIGTDTEFDVSCCLTIWEVVYGSGGLDLRLAAATQRLGVQLISADMDADGTDELFLYEGPLGDGPAEFALLRWNGQRFVRNAFTIPVSNVCCAQIADAGDTDGVAGDDVLVVTPSDEFGSSPLDSDISLYRVTLRAATRPTVESGQVGPVVAANIVQLTAGPAIVTSEPFGNMSLWSWPRDAAPVQLTFRTVGGSPVAIFGLGPQSRILSGSSSTPGTVVVLPGDLGKGLGPSAIFGHDPRVGVLNAAVSAAVDGPALIPFAGVIPTGLPGEANVYVFSGRAVRPVGDSLELAAADDISLLAGVEPIGTVGPDGASMAVLTEYSGPLDQSFGNGVVTPAIQVLAARNAGRLRLVAVQDILTPEEGGETLRPRFDGVVADPDRIATLIVGKEAVDATIEGPPGTQVFWSAQGAVSDREIGADGVATLRLMEASGSETTDGAGMTVSIWLVTPAGHAYSGTWRIRVFREPPKLAVTSGGALVNLSPSVSGRATFGVSVTVNGQPVLVRPDGSFDAPVEVGLLPTDVRVVATDPVGNQSERVLTLVWPIDYRRLPFIPIAVLLTVAAGLALFLRKPDTGPSRRSPEDGASFEEIG